MKLNYLYLDFNIHLIKETIILLFTLYNNIISL